MTRVRMIAPDLRGSMIAELVGVAPLYLWVSKTVPQTERA